ncbi:hypothetical protein HK105_209052 [Polyrhizophydium stewartii]|uniref:Uncharacterized protein n=1 Tax=Polyrhizophydium stewartii TaxID=2732419 RepID=A0ABR4MW14_9FUNG
MAPMEVSARMAPSADGPQAALVVAGLDVLLPAATAAPGDVSFTLDAGGAGGGGGAAAGGGDPRGVDASFSLAAADRSSRLSLLLALLRPLQRLRASADPLQLQLQMPPPQQQQLQQQQHPLSADDSDGDVSLSSQAPRRA